MNAQQKAEQELKLKLAAFIPEAINVSDSPDVPGWKRFTWSDHFPRSDQRVTDGEWLHICHLIEKKFYRRNFYIYVNALRDLCSPDGGYDGHIGHEVNASWQKKAEAIISTAAFCQKNLAECPIQSDSEEE